MDKQTNLLDYVKGKWTMNYLYTNAYLKKEKKTYPIGFALLNVLLALVAINLPIFLVPEAVDVHMGTFGGMNLSGNQNVLILWTVLAVVLVIHILAFVYQSKQQLFFKGKINIPTIVAILWLFLFQENLRFWSSGLCLLTAIFYLAFYFQRKESM